MDLGESVSQTSGVLSYSQNYNSIADAHNNRATSTYNTAINTATAKGDFGKTISGGSSGYQGVVGGLTTARELGNARNFDSEVAGFGTGKGASGYLKSQGQIARDRMAQGVNRAKYAVGATSKEDYTRIANNPRELGLSQETSVSNLQGPIKPGSMPDATRNAGNQLSNDFEAQRQRIAGADHSSVKFGGKDLDTGKVAEASTEGKSITKAGGGLLGEASQGAEGGIEGSVVKSVGKYITDIPKGQLAAAGDVIGKVAGVAQAGKGIYDLASGQDKTTESKWAGAGDIASGVLDIAATAMPVLAPVAAVGAGLSAIGDYFADQDEEDDAKKTAQGKDKTQAGIQGTNLAGSGRVAQQSVSAY